MWMRSGAFWAKRHSMSLRAGRRFCRAKISCASAIEKARAVYSRSWNTPLQQLARMNAVHIILRARFQSIVKAMKRCNSSAIDLTEATLAVREKFDHLRIPVPISGWNAGRCRCRVGLIRIASRNEFLTARQGPFRSLHQLLPLLPGCRRRRNFLTLD